MRKQAAILLCLGMVFLTACKPAETAAPATEPTSSQSAPATESSAAAQSQGSPAASTAPSSSSAMEYPDIQLVVPIQMVLERDDPAAYNTGEQQTLLATETEIDSYRQWLSTLDGADITALYVEVAAVFEYSKGNMSNESSQAVFDKLLLVARDIYPMTKEASRNPYTGGGWSLAIHTKDGITKLSFNGGWLWVSMSDQKENWVFNLEDTDGQKLCSEINQIFYDNINNGAPATTTFYYQGNKLEGLYAINRTAYLMAEVETPALIKEILDGMEGRTTDAALSDYGYLILTGEGKQYQYLSDNDADLALTKSCVAALANSKLHPSWLIHMAPEKLVSANGVTDKQKLLTLVTLLKQEVTVDAKTSAGTGPTNPNTVSGLFDIRMKFDSGTEYSIIGYDYFDGTGDLSIYASDLDTTVYYKLDTGVAAKITKALQSLS